MGLIGGDNMKILNYGSLNIDYVYQVPHIVQPGETISSAGLSVFSGGKGLNQSISLARAGAPVYHAGFIGEDGGFLLDVMRESGVDVRFVRTCVERTGNAIIQVGDSGQNSILLFGGANQTNTKERIDEVLSAFEPGDILLMQNEVNLLSYMLEKADEIGLKVALNPSPYNEWIEACDLSTVSYFLINEVEGAQMTGRTDPDEILNAIMARYPDSGVVLTLGKNGVVYCDARGRFRQDIFDLKVVDTTAAGDTFTGYFLAGMLMNQPVPDVLRDASAASALAVSRKGAAPSIPYRTEVENFLKGVKA